MKTVLIIILLFFISGCTTTQPTVTEYKLSTLNSNDFKAQADGCKDKSLTVSQAFGLSSLISLKMDYTESQNRVFSYSKAQWQESPVNFITLEILKKSRESNLFKNVNSSKSRGKKDYILESSIEEFMQYYSKENNRLYAKVTINLTLVNTKNGDIIASKVFNSKVDAKKANADGGVEALSIALSNILDKKIEWLNGVCK